MPISSRTTSRRRLTPRKTAIIAALTAVVVIAVLELTNTTYLLHARKAVSGTIPSTTTKSESAKKKAASSDNTSSSTPTTDSSAVDSAKNQVGSQQTSSGGNVTAPFGTFVSNHHPELGSAERSSEQSVCQTSPGATCFIKFTSNGIVKKLDAQTADQNGIVIWKWDVKAAGFTEGTWQISVTASLNGASQTTSDPQNLEVSS